MSRISDQILRAAIARVVVGGVGRSIPSFRDRAISLIKKWGNHRVRNHRSIMKRRKKGLFAIDINFISKYIILASKLVSSYPFY